MATVRRRSGPQRLFVSIGALCLTVLPAAAQQRLQPIRVPGTDIVLPAGWKALWTADSRCLYTVPTEWPVSIDRDRAEALDRTIGITVYPVTLTSWSSHRAAILAALGPVVVHADEAHRLWVERLDGAGARHHVSVTDGVTACEADIETHARATSQPIVARIADNLRAGVSPGVRFSPPPNPGSR